MATWLDILSQNYSDSQGRFNPFALARGFTSKGRGEIDEQQQIASLGRQEMIQGSQARIGARQFMAGQPDPMSASPRSPEEAEILSLLTQLAHSRGAITQQGVNTDVGRQNLIASQQMLPHQVEAARLSNMQAGENLVEQQAGQVDRMRLLAAQADTARSGAQEFDRNAPTRRRILENQANALQPEVLQYLQQAGYGSMGIPGQEDQLRQVYAPFIPNLPMTGPGQQRSDGGQQQALTEAIRNAGQQEQFTPTQQSGAGGPGILSQIGSFLKNPPAIPGSAFATGNQGASQTSTNKPAQRAPEPYRRRPLQGGTAFQPSMEPASGGNYQPLQFNINPQVMELIRRAMMQTNSPVTIGAR